MKVVQLNCTCGAGSTGKICVSISNLLNEKSIENHIVYSSGRSTHPNGIRYMSHVEIKFQALKSRVLGKYGFNSKAATKRLLKQLEAIDPDIIHLHNLHGHNCHIGMLFAYIKRKNIKTYWTFHDCWAFTAYCPHFDMERCEQWKNGCHKCPQRKIFSWFFDRSEWLYEQKESATSAMDLIIITPSQWLADLTRESFLKDYPVRVINNGIDLSVFRPRTSDFRRKHHCEDKYLLLGVAFDWGIRKGLDVFVELAGRLPENYQIVLVGTDDKVDKQLPDNIISIHRTQDQTELAEIYTAADLFVNPTREEVLGLVNIEALACGTPALTFRTGGSPECIDETCGSVVDCDDVDAMEKEIFRICTQRPYSLDACLNRAKEFDMNERFEEYIELYENGKNR